MHSCVKMKTTWAATKGHDNELLPSNRSEMKSVFKEKTEKQIEQPNRESVQNCKCVPCQDCVYAAEDSHSSYTTVNEFLYTFPL